MNKFADVLETSAHALKKVVHPITTFLVYLSAISSFIMALLVLLDVVMRVVFDRPITGIIELETIMLGVLCFFSIAYTAFEDGHVSVDIFIKKFPENFKLFLGCFFPILGIFFFSVVSWQFIVRTQDSMRDFEVTDMMGWALWPFFLIAAIGCALLCLVLVIDYLKNQSRLIRGFSKPWFPTLLVWVLASVLIGMPMLLKTFSIEFEPFSVGLFMMAVMIILLFLGFPVAYTMGLIGLVGTWFLADTEVVLGLIRTTIYGEVANYFLCTIPFFVLMGLICLRSGVSQKLYDSAYKWFGWLPGGLSIGTIFACGIFAAVSGDSLSCAATMGSVSLPEMKKYNYSDALATGCVAAGGTLGILIPPSLGFIFYAIITEESVSKLFAAGIIPGIILVLMFSAAVSLLCFINPALGPKGPIVPFREKIIAIKDVWTVMVLFIVVIGGIYAGFFTPTEAGGIGVIGAFIVSLASRGFSFKGFWWALMGTAQITGMVAGIMIGMTILGYFVALTEIPMKLSDFISSLATSRYVIFALILFLYFILGMVMNIIPMIMLTLPIIFPTIIALGFDPIWFGVIMVLMMEMGQISPPVGINVFVISGVAKNVPMSTIFIGILPFMLMELILIIILTIFPQIIMILPDAIKVLPNIG